MPRRESDSGVCQARRDSRGRYSIEAGEVDRRTAGVHRPVQIHPLSFHSHLSLVHPARVVRRLEVPAQAPLQFRSIPLDLSPDGDVIPREPLQAVRNRNGPGASRGGRLPEAEPLQCPISYGFAESRDQAHCLHHSRGQLKVGNLRSDSSGQPSRQ